jgi:dTMP kinase
MFITFEGIDGSGKTTQVDRLRNELQQLGRTVLVAREPGCTPIGESIRKLLLDGPRMSAWTEASLFAAARAELVDAVIRPALDRGDDVILDRYFDSSLAYQCMGRGLDFDAVLQWNLSVVEGVEPDLTFLLALPAEDATSRVGRQLRLFPLDGAQGPPDRIERESIEFRRAVEEGYRDLAERFPARIVEIDASLSKRSIAAAIRARVRDCLAQTEAAAAA